MSERFVLKAFADLSLRELYEVMVLRNDVFVVGQKITEEAEVDGLDPECHHALLYDGEELVGTARLFWADEPVKVGRVAVARGRQRGGLGTRLMLGVQEALGARRAKLHAQAYLEEWYARLGWERQGEVFDEAGIDHVVMYWKPTNRT